MNKVHYNVSGLLNEQVKTQIKNILNDMDGISQVNVDLVNGSVEVGYNDIVNTKDIMDGIARTGCKIE